MTDPKRLGTVENALSPDYRAHMAATVEQGICPFCQLDTTKNVVLRENGHWRIWKNPFAYRHHAHHLVIASVAHVEDIAALSPYAWKQLGELVQWAVAHFNIQGGGIVMRFGNPALSASTLHHLHMHIQVPDGTGPAFAVFCKEGFRDLVGD